MNETLSLLTAFLLGFMGSAHCLGMCGGIVSALTLNNQHSSPTTLNLTYQFGRITTYSLLGVMVGLLGLWASESHQQAMVVLRTLSGLLLLLMGLYILGVTQSLVWLERGGQHLWKRVQPLSATLFPVTSYPKAFSLGMVWGFLPCGLIYSTLSWAAVTADPISSGLLMAAFGLGNLPALLAVGLFAERMQRLRQNTLLKGLFGGSIMLFGLWTLHSIWSSFHKI